METWRIWTITFYCGLAAAFIGLLGFTNYYQPLFPFKLDNLEWCRLWLGTTVGDYYVVVISFSSFILATESWLHSILWVAGICLLGSPISCIYIVFRICKGSTLKIN